jgi:hypothetical protein
VCLAGVDLNVGPCDYLQDWDNSVGELSYLLLESGVWTLVLARKLTDKRLLAQFDLQFAPKGAL